MSASILFVGDMHLGRRPTVPDDDLREVGLSPRAVTPVRAWERTVELAIARGVRAVVLAGDVVDQDKDRFEAFEHLFRGAQRLDDAGITLAVVAGNHDALALPRLVQRLPSVKLLGQGGRWELWTLPGEGPPVDLLGWSFPARHHREDPTGCPRLSDVLSHQRPEAVTLGVLHGDLGARSSRYAPVDPARLAAQPVHGWFLGHIHTPTLGGEGRPMGYLGSLSGLHVGDTGPRGPWLVQVDQGLVRAEQLPIAPIRWIDVRVPLPEVVDDLEDLDDQMREAVRLTIAGVPSGPSPDVWAVRVVFEGRLRDRATVQEAVRSARVSHDVVDDVPVLVVRLDDRTTRAVDLAALARRAHPAGVVAELLLRLGRDGDEALMREAAALLETRLPSKRWGEDPAPPLPEALERAAWDALEVLLGQRPLEVA